MARLLIPTDTSQATLGYLLADGSIALTANWPAGAFDIKADTFTLDSANGDVVLSRSATNTMQLASILDMDANNIIDIGANQQDLSSPASGVLAVSADLRVIGNGIEDSDGTTRFAFDPANNMQITVASSKDFIIAGGSGNIVLSYTETTFGPSESLSSIIFKTGSAPQVAFIATEVGFNSPTTIDIGGINTMAFRNSDTLFHVPIDITGDENVDKIALTVVSTTAQTKALQAWQKNDDTDLASMRGDGNIASASGAVWDFFDINAMTQVITGSTNITTATGFNLVNLSQPTLSNASITVTNAATLYIANAPTVTGGMSLSNAFALWVDNGAVRFDGTLDVTDKLTVTDDVLIDGKADQIQLTVQGHSTQTLDLFVVEKSDGTDLLTVANSGDLNVEGDFGIGLSGGDPADALHIKTTVATSRLRIESTRARATVNQGFEFHDATGSAWAFGEFQGDFFIFNDITNQFVTKWGSDIVDFANSSLRMGASPDNDIQDSGGAIRITVASGTPQLILTGTTQITTALGINEAAPDEKLHITGAAAETMRLKIESPDARATTVNIGFRFVDASGNAWSFGEFHGDFFIFDDVNSKFTFYQKAGGDLGINTGSAAPSAQLHVDQNATDGAQPVLFLDQADVSEQCIQFSSDTSASTGVDINLFTVNVPGNPKLSWDESADDLIFSTGVQVESRDVNRYAYSVG